MMEERICPRCGNTYTNYPAISRRDNKTAICPQCGIDEAFEDYFRNIVSPVENIYNILYNESIKDDIG